MGSLAPHVGLLHTEVPQQRVLPDTSSQSIQNRALVWDSITMYAGFVLPRGNSLRCIQTPRPRHSGITLAFARFTIYSSIALSLETST
eukprot:4963736-Pyramimonas_sp.AAC.1